jgi:hypothetical protein
MVFIFPPVIQAALCQGDAAKTSCKHGGFSGMVNRALFFGIAHLLMVCTLITCSIHRKNQAGAEAEGAGAREK